MSEFLQIVRQADASLAAVLRLLEHDHPGNTVTPDQMAGILALILEVGEWLQQRGMPESSPDLASAIAEYRDQLERLRAVLPSLRVQLLMERTRLEAERSHLKTASAWAESARASR